MKTTTFLAASTLKISARVADCALVLARRIAGRATGTMVACFVAAALCAAPALATTIVLHSGANDPTTEGWSESGAIANLSVGPVASDVGGYAGWQVNDPSNSFGGNYIQSVSSGDAAEGTTEGWTLSMRLRVVNAPDDTDLSVWGEYTDGSKRWRLAFGSEPDGDAAVQLGGTIFTPQGTGNIHHLYELVYDPNSATVDLFVDGIERISNHAGISTSDAPYVAWGSGSSQDTGNGIYNLVQLEVVPEPSSIALMGLGAAALGMCATRCRRRRRG